MNIDEIEFEEICKEILERKTGKSFKVFGRGADGGIDIQANDNPKIIGQVKLYINTPQSNTVNKIKSEINRIKYNEIEEYYIFIGREMSPQNIEEIYEEGKNIIKSKENIFTIKEINELLNKEEYMDIVRQHIKLWTCATNVYAILADLHCELPDALYDQMEFPEVESWSFDEKEMHEIVLKYISYVYNTYEEDYTYYKKYIYDGHLLNKSTEEEKIIKDLFLKS